MSSKKGFTLVELLVVIAIIAVLMGILMPALASVKEIGKRAVCVSNLRQMTLAWSNYSENNNDRIVRGVAYGGGDGTNGMSQGQLCWTGDDVADIYGRTHLPSDTQLQAIQVGALYPYVSNEKSYRCPTGLPGEMRTYSIVDSMNAQARDGALVDGRPISINSVKTWFTQKMDIKQAATRMVFVDEGMATGDSFATNYNRQEWWDPASCRHGDGNTFSFADGHTEYWKWLGDETIENGKLLEPEHNMVPTTDNGLRDLLKFQLAVYGSVGYNI